MISSLILQCCHSFLNITKTICIYVSSNIFSLNSLLIIFMNKTIDKQLIQQNDKFRDENYILMKDMRQLEDLEIKVRQLQFNLDMADQRCLRAEKKLHEQQLHLKQLNKAKRNVQFKLLEEVRDLKNRNKKIQLDYDRVKKELELKEILQKEESRVMLSAAIHHTQQELQRERLQFEEQFLNECEQLRMQVREKDEKMRLTMKKLHNYHSSYINEEDEYQQYGRVVSFIRDIGSIQELNATIYKLRGDVLAHKKQLNIMGNTNSELQLRNLQMMEQISDLKLALQKSSLQSKEAQQNLSAMKLQFQREVTENKKLQAYFSHKWVKQFQQFRSILQKAYESKLEQIKKQYQSRISSDHSKEQNLNNLHQQDQKIICSLQKQITQLTIEVQQSKEIIVKLESQNTQIKKEIVENHQIIAEFTHTFQHKQQKILKQKELEIEELKKAINNSAALKDNYQNKIVKLRRKLKQDFQGEKKTIEHVHAKQKQQLLTAKKQQTKQLIKKHEVDLIQQKGKQQSLKAQLQSEIQYFQNKAKKQANELTRQLEQSRSTVKDILVEAQFKQRTLTSEFEQFKKASQKEVQKIKKDAEEKTSVIRSLHQKAKHDDNLKRELRYLYELKIKEYNQLLKENEVLINNKIEQEHQINKLNRLAINNDIQKLVAELRNQFRLDLYALNQIHWKQAQISRSKIHDLESIICRRQLEDEQKIVNLTHENSMLETKLQVIQRKRSREIPTSLPLSSISFIQPRKNLFMSRRKKRGNFHFSQTVIKSGKESSAAAAIIRMKRFLERGKSTQIYDSEKSLIKSRYLSPTTQR